MAGLEHLPWHTSLSCLGLDTAVQTPFSGSNNFIWLLHLSLALSLSPASILCTGVCSLQLSHDYIRHSKLLPTWVSTYCWGRFLSSTERRGFYRKRVLHHKQSQSEGDEKNAGRSVLAEREVDPDPAWTCVCWSSYGGVCSLPARSHCCQHRLHSEMAFTRVWRGCSHSGLGRGWYREKKGREVSFSLFSFPWLPPTPKCSIILHLVSVPTGIPTYVFYCLQTFGIVFLFHFCFYT